VLAAKVIPGAEITLGTGKDMGRVVAMMGAKHVDKPLDGVHVDTKHKLVTTPAYMVESAMPYQVYDGIGKMVDQVLRLVDHH
jgi:enhancing lycopene biosynthesis protein 2